MPAVHSGYRPPLGPTAPALGFVIEGSRSVYFAGDTDLFAGMGELGGPSTWRCCRSGAGGRRSVAACTWIRFAPRSRCASSGRAPPCPIHWGTYWPHAMGRVFPERLVEPPAAFAEYASELAPDVRILPTAVGDVVSFEDMNETTRIATPEDQRPLVSRGGLRRLSTGLIVYGAIGLLIAAPRTRAPWPGRTVASRRSPTGWRTSVDEIATTLERTSVALENAATTAESFTGTIDRTVEGVASAADTIKGVRSNLETLENAMRAVDILGLTPLGAPAAAVGGIADALEGLDSRLFAIADSLEGNRDALAANATSLGRVADSTAAMAERLRSGVVEDSLADVQAVLMVLLVLMVAWTAVPAVGALLVGIWIRRELAPGQPTA